MGLKLREPVKACVVSTFGGDAELDSVQNRTQSSI
jgi:hypothetical protein